MNICWFYKLNKTLWALGTCGGHFSPTFLDILQAKLWIHYENNNNTPIAPLIGEEWKWKSPSKSLPHKQTLFFMISGMNPVKLQLRVLYNDRAAVVLQGRQHAHLVYWSQTRNTRTIVPESPLFIVMAWEEKEAERLLSNSSMSHPPQMRLSPKAWSSSSALIQYLLLATCKMVPLKQITAHS